MTNRGVIFIFKGNLHKNLVVRALAPIVSTLSWFGPYLRRKNTAQSLSAAIISTLIRLYSAGGGTYISLVPGLTVFSNRAA